MTGSRWFLLKMQNNKNVFLSSMPIEKSKFFDLINLTNKCA